MEYTIKAKPTLYKGIEFRSRLEARWAAFFDLLEWKWEYEPCDFNGWYPDFVIFGKVDYGKSGRNIYVEVKPIIEFSREVGNRMANSLPDSFNGEAILVGQRPFDIDDSISIGWCLFGGYWHHDEGGGYDKSHAIFGQWEDSPNIGICSDTYNFADMVSGKYDGGCFGAGEFNPNMINSLWGMAHKAVRFEPKRKAVK